jgi:hypothetical protein
LVPDRKLTLFKLSQWLLKLLLWSLPEDQKRSAYKSHHHHHHKHRKKYKKKEMPDRKKIYKNI